MGGFLVLNGQYAPKNVGGLTPTPKPDTSLALGASGSAKLEVSKNSKNQTKSEQTQKQHMTPTPPQEAQSAVIKTDKGDITIMFYGKDAPKTVANFVQKSRSGFYNNLTFHRVEDWVIQGGDPEGNGTGGGDILTELNDHPFEIGSVGVARAGDIRVSNDAQFFITKTDASHLNNQYTNFGKVTSGMEVVNQIQIGDKILGITIQ